MPSQSSRAVRAVTALVLSVSAPFATACVAGPPVAAPSEPPTRAIVFPLATAVRFSDTYGAARSGGRAHEGQDLMVSKGVEVVAVVDGTVTFVRHSNDGSAGNMLRLTDADGWQYIYVHLNNDNPGTDDGANVFEQAFADGIRVGQRVKAGETIGFVGDSGNAESTGSHLHFELRHPDGSAANAYSSLRAAPVAPLREVSLIVPFGVVDELVSTAAGQLRVRGWAIDAVVADAVVISVYVDGTPAAIGTADGDRPDLVDSSGRGAAHGFDLTVDAITAGTHRVCVIAHNAGAGGGSARLRCETISIS